jgi:hypothetical protein
MKLPGQGPSISSLTEFVHDWKGCVKYVLLHCKNHVSKNTEGKMRHKNRRGKIWKTVRLSEKDMQGMKRT